MRQSPATPTAAVAGQFAPWAGWLLAPLAWAAHQNLSYGFTYWICAAGQYWPFLLVTLLAAAGAGAAAAISWRGRQPSVRALESGGRSIRRRLFIGTVGTLFALICTAGIVVESIPMLFLGPCAGAT